MMSSSRPVAVLMAGDSRPRRPGASSVRVAAFPFPDALPLAGGDLAQHEVAEDPGQDPADDPGRDVAARDRADREQDPDERAGQRPLPGLHRLRRARLDALAEAHSHSIVPGGLLVMSSTTRLTSRISLIMREAICSSRSYGRRAQSAVIASSEVTARIATR